MNVLDAKGVCVREGVRKVVEAWCDTQNKGIRYLGFGPVLGVVLMPVTAWFSDSEVPDWLGMGKGDLMSFLFILIVLCFSSVLLLDRPDALLDSERNVPDEVLLGIASSDQIPLDFKEALALRLGELTVISFADLYNLVDGFESEGVKRKIKEKSGYQEMMKFQRKGEK